MQKVVHITQPLSNIDNLVYKPQYFSIHMFAYRDNFVNINRIVIYVLFQFFYFLLINVYNASFHIYIIYTYQICIFLSLILYNSSVVLYCINGPQFIYVTPENKHWSYFQLSAITNNAMSILVCKLCIHMHFFRINYLKWNQWIKGYKTSFLKV